MKTRFLFFFLMICTFANAQVPTFSPTLTIANITATTADISGIVNSSVSVFSRYQLATGSMANVASATVVGNTNLLSGSQTATFSLNNLLPSTTYYFRFVAENPSGISYSSIGTFTTTDSSPHIYSSTTAIGTINGATIAISLNAYGFATTSFVRYGLSSVNLSSQVVGPTANFTNLTGGFAEIAGLLPNTTYYCQVVATNSMGTTTSAILSFVTLTPPSLKFHYPFNNSLNSTAGSGAFSAANTSFVANRNSQAISALRISSTSVPSTATTATDLPLGNGLRSISIWHKKQTHSVPLGIFGYGTNAAGRANLFGFYLNATGDYVFQNGLADYTFTGTSTSPDVWTQTVLTFDIDSKVRLYNNGVLVGTSPLVNLTTTRSSFRLAGNGGIFDLDDLQVYDYALNQAQITALYQANEVSTWTGTAWDNGTPVSTTLANIANTYFSSNITAQSLAINAAVTIPSGFKFTISNGIAVSEYGSLTIQNNANLLQINAATNTGNVVVKRNTNLKRLDSTFWSSPVAKQNALAFSPATLPNRFYTFNEATNSFNNIVASTTNFVAGRGYSIRAPNNFTAVAASFTGNFTGVPNNGTISVPISTTASQGNGYNLIGNPYPSTLNGLSFLTTNPGALYFWTHTVFQGGVGNYASFSVAGGVAVSLAATLSPSTIPDGNIQVGQGFMFLPASATTTTAVFNNTMRSATNNNQFFRTQNSQSNDKFWLNLTTANNDFSQILVAYLPETTTGFDGGFDAKQINTAGVVLSSMLNADKMAIQSRNSFVTNDQFSLGFKTSTAGTYKLSLGDRQGVFANNQNIFLKDNLTGTLHNLTQNDYTFVSDIVDSSNRFEIVYKSNLSNNSPVFGAENVIVFENNKSINIAASTDLKSVKIFDLQGRIIFEVQNIDNKSFMLNGFEPKQQVLLVQIENANNQIITKKVLF